MKTDWTIPEGSPDWECDWEGSTRFQLRYFRALPITDKLRAVENMCRTARYFEAKAAARRARRRTAATH
jgi:hypothetical protein